MNALSADKLVVEGPEGRLVDGVSLAIPKGSSLTILGESGSGKSLLAQAILGALPRGLQAQGSVGILDQSFDAAETSERAKLWGRAVSILPQEPWLALDPTMRSAEQVAEVHALVRSQPWPAARQLGRANLEAAGLAHAARAFPHTLSGGMAQRVSFAVTQAAAAPVLVVDEPTKGLDAPLRAQVLAELRRVLAEGGSLLTITHDVELAKELGGRIAVMLEGRFVEQGEAAQVLASPAHAYTRALLAAAPASWPAAPERAAGAPILTATGIGKSYSGRRLFGGLDVALSRGERLAIVGGSGSGKSTLGSVLLGLRQPDEGRVERAAGLSPLAFQKLYQDPAAAWPPAITLRRAMDDLIERHGPGWDDARTMMTRLRLNEALLERRPSQVSSGELQRFALVRILLLKPALIFADEPTSRLDPINQRATFDLLLETAGANEAAVVLVTHDPDIARATSHRVIRLGVEPAA